MKSFENNWFELIRQH